MFWLLTAAFMKNDYHKGMILVYTHHFVTVQPDLYQYLRSVVSVFMNYTNTL